MVGTSQQLFSNILGCDSLVITTTALTPNDTTLLSSTTCDPNATGTFTAIFPSSTLCDSIVIETVTFDPALCVLDATVESNSVLCNGAADGALIVLVQNGGVPPYSYSWMESSGNTGNGTINTIGTPDTIPNLPAGTYSITITDNSGFIQTTLNLNIDEPSPLNLQTTIDSDYNGFDVSCDGLPDGIASAVATGGTNPISYLWENGTIGAQASGLSAGNYTVTATDANGCSITAGVSLSAPPALNLQLVTGNVQCGDTATTVSYLAQGGIEPYEFYIDGAPQAGTTSLLTEGSYILQLADANGCSLDSVFALNLPDPPQLFLPTDTVVALGSTLTLEALTNVTTWDSLYWSPPADSSCVACLTQVWQPQVSQAYTLTLIDTLGCIVSARILVGVEKTIPLYIPNVFKPDDDGFNDFFTIGAGPSIVELETLSIFDRWGNQVYQLLAPTPVEDWMGWDGTFRGEKMNPGVYIYLLRVRLIDGTTVDKAGDLLLSR
ncbi:MAG: gliding motility-associated C-terminal domain-containing protein [Saprospiraceae bacterium]